MNRGRLGFLSRGQKPNPLIKTKTYRIAPSTSTSISSGSVILAVGLSIGLSIPASSFQENYGFIGINSPYAFSAMLILIFQFTLGVVFQFGGVIWSLIFGWFIGGVIASIIYDQEGRKGPFYSSIIAISLTFALSFILGIVFFSKSGGTINFEIIVLPLIALLLLSLFMALISIPLILIAIIGYKFGGWMSNV